MDLNLSVWIRLCLVLVLHFRALHSVPIRQRRSLSLEIRCGQRDDFTWECYCQQRNLILTLGNSQDAYLDCGIDQVLSIMTKDQRYHESPEEKVESNFDRLAKQARQKTFWGDEDFERRQPIKDQQQNSDGKFNGYGYGSKESNYQVENRNQYEPPERRNNYRNADKRLPEWQNPNNYYKRPKFSNNGFDKQEHRAFSSGLDANNGNFDDERRRPIFNVPTPLPPPTTTSMRIYNFFNPPSDKNKYYDNSVQDSEQGVKTTEPDRLISQEKLDQHLQEVINGINLDLQPENDKQERIYVSSKTTKQKLSSVKENDIQKPSTLSAKENVFINDRVNTGSFDHSTKQSTTVFSIIEKPTTRMMKDETEVQNDVKIENVQNIDNILSSKSSIGLDDHLVSSTSTIAHTTSSESLPIKTTTSDVIQAKSASELSNTEINVLRDEINTDKNSTLEHDQQNKHDQQNNAENNFDGDTNNSIGDDVLNGVVKPDWSVVNADKTKEANELTNEESSNVITTTTNPMACRFMDIDLAVGQSVSISYTCKMVCSGKDFMTRHCSGDQSKNHKNEAVSNKISAGESDQDTQVIIQSNQPSEEQNTLDNVRTSTDSYSNSVTTINKTTTSGMTNNQTYVSNASTSGENDNTLPEITTTIPAACSFFDKALAIGDSYPISQNCKMVCTAVNTIRRDCSAINKWKSEPDPKNSIINWKGG